MVSRLPLSLLTAAIAFPVVGAAADSLSLFRQRIVPILNAKNPSSCSECHLGGVDLKDYLRPSQEETFAALKQSGLIDTQRPEKSKLLAFVRRKPEKPTLSTEKLRQAEYDALLAWLQAAVVDPELAAAKTKDASLGSSLPPEVVRHLRRDRVLTSFVDNVWSEVGRCAACHSPDRNGKQVKEHGEHISWIRLGDPQATLDHLREHELINISAPEKSLILLKPLNQVKHGGGQKMLVGDRTYKQFRAFLDDYAASLAGKYQSPAELPQSRAEVSQVTDIWFKLEGVPKEYDKLLLQVDLYRWDEQAQAWSSAPWANGDRAVFGGGQLWQQHLSVTAPRDSERAKLLAANPFLPAGKYRAKIYLDRQKKLERDFRAELSDEELVGAVEFDSRWPSGYGKMTIVRFPAK
jgi:mono/diheme cytochrome c family protein